MLLKPLPVSHPNSIGFVDHLVKFIGPGVSYTSEKLVSLKLQFCQAVLVGIGGFGLPAALMNLKMNALINTLKN